MPEQRPASRDDSKGCRRASVPARLAASWLTIASSFLAGAGAAYAAPARVETHKTMRAAEAGSAKAQAYLGWLYSSGSGVPQSHDRAAYWYYCAARQGHGTAEFALGMLFNKGHGVRQDFRLAYAWLNLSAAQVTGQERDFKRRIRDAVASKLTKADLTFAQHLALVGPANPAMAPGAPHKIPVCPERLTTPRVQ